MWTTPKVNWKSTDYYNIEDWQRVRSNLEHLRNALSNQKVAVPALLPTDTGRGYAELPYVHLVNNMEENLETLQRLFGVDFAEDVAPKTWYARLDSSYETNPTYLDWIRWERILLLVHDAIQYVDTYVFQQVSGACYSGSKRTVSRFSRGR